MHFEGNPEVLHNLVRKKRLLRRAEPAHANIRPALLVLSGSMRGVYGGAQALALEEEGFTDVFDYAIGVSTGAPTVAYFLAKQVPIGLSIYLTECASSAFISKRRALMGGPIADVDYVAGVFRGSTGKRLDEARLRESRTGCFFCVTHAETGEAIIVDGKTVMPDTVEGMRASAAIPIASKPVFLNGIPMLDGGIASPLPAREVLRRFRPTDLIVLANRTERYREDGLARRFLERQMMKKLPEALVHTIRIRQERFDEELSLLRAQTETRVGVFWADDSLRSFTRNRRTLRETAHRSWAYMKAELRAAHASA